tara:strand:+ start:323 stop:1192 length:870 start_codon:yes stop_codon:yes gene_type:complete
MISKIKFILIESIRGFYYAWTPALLSCITIGISLIVISISFYSYILFINYSSSFTNEYELDVFFNNDLSLESAQNIYNKIILHPAILDGEFVNKKKSSDKFKEYFNSNIENLLGENPLPYSAQFLIKDKNRTPDSLLVLSSNLSKIEGVDTIQYNKEILIRIHSILNKVMTAFSIIGIAIVVISIILVSNTTRLMIHSKKENIQILSLMGATNFFIRIPFLLEGIFQGIIGSLFSIFSLLILKNLLEYIFIPLIIANDYNFQLIIILNFSLGIMFGLIGSKRAVSKYLS